MKNQLKMRRKSILFQLLSLLLVSCMQAPVENGCFRPGEVWLDTEGKPINAHGGCVIFADSTYYWYGEHKIPGRSEEEKADGGVHCYSSRDLYNWKDEGLVLAVDTENSKSDIAAGCILERPKVIWNDQTLKYMMFFKLYPKGLGYEFGYLGVASAEKPTGPFVYSHMFLPADSDYGSGDFSIFKDLDGQVYHYTVRKPDKAFVMGRLNREYTFPESSYVELQGIAKHTEAPAVLYDKGRYYMIGSGSSGWAPNAARSYVATTSSGPFFDTGNPCKGVNPHNGLGPDKTFGGQSSYIFPVQGKENAYIAMFDIWKPEMPIKGLYMWLPVQLNEGGIRVEWMSRWDLSVFDTK